MDGIISLALMSMYNDYFGIKILTRIPAQDCSLTVSGVTAKWSNATEENTLTDVSFSVKAGELLAVVGPVGSGKVCNLHLFS